MSKDARYDQPQHFCTCGCGVFVTLTPVVLHQRSDRPLLGALPPVAADAADQARIDRLPVMECVQCRSRYDSVGRSVG